VRLTLAAARYPCQAIDDMDVAIKLLERSRVVFTPLVTRAVSLRAQGRLDEALTDLKKALSRRPSDIPTMLLLGQVHTRPPTHAPPAHLNSTHALRGSHGTAPRRAAVFPAWAESKAERKRLRAEKKLSQSRIVAGPRPDEAMFICKACRLVSCGMLARMKPTSGVVGDTCWRSNLCQCGRVGSTALQQGMVGTMGDDDRQTNGMPPNEREARMRVRACSCTCKRRTG
jgi:hypothetical protein